jgi:hypothetical protein
MGFHFGTAFVCVKGKTVRCKMKLGILSVSRAPESNCCIKTDLFEKTQQKYRST